MIEQLLAAIVIGIFLGLLISWCFSPSVNYYKYDVNDKLKDKCKSNTK